MDKKVLLIGASEVINGSIIENNVDVKLLTKTIAIVQEMYLKAILGVELYNELVDAVYEYSTNNTPLIDKYKDLIEALKPYLISKVAAEFIITNSFKLTDKGLLKLNDNNAGTLSLKDIESVKDYYNNVTDVFKNDLIKYLRQTNLITYTGDNNVASSFGWFLGNEFINETPVITQDYDTYVAPQFSYQELNKLNKVLLVSPIEVINNSVIESNIDTSVLSNTIKVVQDTKLKDILSNQLYYSILSGINELNDNGTHLKPLYVDLLVLIKPYLINKTVAEYIVTNSYKVTDKGLLKLTDNSGRSVESGDINSLRNYYNNIASSYKKDIIDFLKKYNVIAGLDRTYDESGGWYLGVNCTTNIGVDEPIQSTYIDTYLTGVTYSSNTLTLQQNNNKQDLSVGINSFTALTVNNLISSTLSATTYLNLPIDIRVTGGTYSNGTLALTNNTGGTININGFKTNDVYVTGGTYSNGVISLTNNTGNTFNIGGLYTGTPITITGGTNVNVSGAYPNFVISSIDTNTFITGGSYSNGTLQLVSNSGTSVNVNGFYTGFTGGVVSGLTATTISANTYLNLPLDIKTTGGTYSNGVLSLVNNTGGTINISGFKTNDIYVSGGTVSGQSLVFTNTTGGTFSVSGFDAFTTGFTYDNANTLSLQRNQGQTPLTATINVMTGLTVGGNLVVTGNTMIGYASGSTTINKLDVNGATRITGTLALDNATMLTNGATGGVSITTTNNRVNIVAGADVRVTNLSSIGSSLVFNNGTNGLTGFRNNFAGGTNGATGVAALIGTTSANSTQSGGDVRMIDLRPVYSKDISTGVFFRGLYYAPDITSLTGSGFTHRAIETTTGDNCLNTTSGVVMIGSTTSTGEKFQVNGSSRFNSTYQLTINEDQASPRIFAGQTIRYQSNVASMQHLFTNQIGGNTNGIVRIEYGGSAANAGVAVNLLTVGGGDNNGIAGYSSGNATYTCVNVNPKINSSGTYSGQIMGIVFNPILTSVSSGMTIVGFQNTAGNNYFNSSAGNTVIGTSASTTNDKLQVSGSIISTQYKLSALNTAPTSSSDTGTLGEIRYDANYIYLCVATNTWKRSALTTW